MITSIAKKEILVSLTSIRFIITILVCCLLMPLSTWVLSNDYVNELADYNSRVELEANRAPQGKEYATVVSRPVPPLSSLFRGVNNAAVNSVNLKYFIGWNMPQSVGRQSITSAIFPTVDITFIVGIVLSGLALMLSFDSLSGEKDQATLRLIMSNSVPRANIVLGKWLGLSVVILIPYLMGIILSLLVYFVIAGVSLAMADLIALSIGIVITMLYLVLFILIGITVSAFTRNPSLSILISLGIWGALIFVIPQLGNAVATEFEEVPTSQMIERDIRIAYNEMATAMREKNMAITEKAKRENIPYREWNPERFSTDMELASQNRKEANQIEREFWLKVRQQEQASRMFSMVSPYSAMSQALMGLASTGPRTQREFMRQAYSYGERYFNTVWDLMINTDQDQTDVIPNQPPFKFDAPSLAERLDAALLPGATIVLMALVLAMVAVIRFNNYDVR